MEPEGPANVIIRKSDEGSQEGVGEIHPQGRLHCRQVRYAETSYSWEDKTEEEVNFRYFVDLRRYEVKYDWQSEDFITEEVWFRRTWYERIYTTYSRKLSVVHSWTENTCNPGIKFTENTEVMPGEWEETGKTEELFFEDEDRDVIELNREPSVWKKNRMEKEQELVTSLTSTILDPDLLKPREAPFRSSDPSQGQTGVEERIFGYSKSNEPGTIYLTQGAGLNTRNQALWKGAIGMQVSRETIQGAQRVNGYVSPVQWDTGTIIDVNFNPQVTAQQQDDIHHVTVTITYGWYRLLISTVNSSSESKE